MLFSTIFYFLPLTPVHVLTKLSGEINGEMLFPGKDKNKSCSHLLDFVPFSVSYFFMNNFSVKWRREISERNPLNISNVGKVFSVFNVESVRSETLISSFQRKMLFIA